MAKIERGAEAIGERAANAINSVSCLLHTLLWVAEKCEDAHDFEQFHALAAELMPRMGMSLEQTIMGSGHPSTGIFDEVMEPCHAS